MSAASGVAHPAAPLLAHQIILKVASRCNLACDYCHWFRDESVLGLPRVMSADVEAAFLGRLEDHARSTGAAELSVVVHGGEPLLFPRARFDALCRGIRAIEARTATRFTIALTTNGVLLSPEWCDLFRWHRVRPCVSVDGPAAVHDRHRVDHAGRGTHAAAVRGIQTLRANGFPDPSVLCVCDPTVPARDYVAFVVDELGVRTFDILIPNFNHDDGAAGRVPSVAAFYRELFDLWYDTYAGRGVRIRCVESFAASLLGRRPALGGVGGAPLATVSVRTDGGIEPHDVLRIGGHRQVDTGLNVMTHPLRAVLANPVWREAFDASVTLSAECRRCSLATTCGGGYVIHRFSEQRRYDNPSVYCSDLKSIYAHVGQRISQDLFVAEPA